MIPDPDFVAYWYDVDQNSDGDEYRVWYVAVVDADGEPIDDKWIICDDRDDARATALAEGKRRHMEVEEF